MYNFKCLRRQDKNYSYRKIITFNLEDKKANATKILFQGGYMRNINPVLIRSTGIIRDSKTNYRR